MKILVPLNDVACLSRYIDAGADEFYLGFYDEKWFEIFGNYSDINRMSGFRQHANRYNFEQAMEVARCVKKNERSVFLTLNANFYSSEQITYIKEKYFPAIQQAGIDGLIVSEYALAKAAEEAGIPTVASTMCAIYNSDILHYYAQSGMRRMILPRDLSLDEIASICKENPDIQIELFFMRNGCTFSDCYCLGMHRPECGATCSFLKHSPKSVAMFANTFEEKHNYYLTDSLYNTLLHKNACGMCALYRMKCMNIYSLKIVGRADNADSVCRDIALAKENIAIAEKCHSEEEYLEKMILPPNAATQCLLGLSCYYPEVRF